MDYKLEYFKLLKQLELNKPALIYSKSEENISNSIIPLLKADKTKEQVFDLTNKFNYILEGESYYTLKSLLFTHLNSVDFIFTNTPYISNKETFIFNGKAVKNDDVDKFNKWLTYLEKRLKLAKQLLSEDGVICLSVNDEMMHKLKMLCDSIFGELNYIGSFVQNKLNTQNDKYNIQNNHDYILVYAKELYLDKKEKNLFKTKTYREQKVLQDSDGFYYRDSGLLMGGNSEGSTLNGRPKLGYTVYFNPETKHIVPKVDYNIDLAKVSNDSSEIYTDDSELISSGYIPLRPRKLGDKIGCWKWSIEKTLENLNLLDITQSKNGFVIYRKKYVENESVFLKGSTYYAKLEQDATPKSILESSTLKATNELKSILGEKPDSTIINKSVDLIKKLILFYAKDDAVVLDFFAGSGSTAHAVLDANKEDNGDRTFILCADSYVLSEVEIDFLVRNNYISPIPAKKSGEVYKNWKLELQQFYQSDEYSRLIFSQEYKDLCTLNKYLYTRLQKINNGYTSQKGLTIQGYKSNMKFYMMENSIDTSKDMTDFRMRKLVHLSKDLLSLKYKTNEEIVDCRDFSIFSSETTSLGVLYKLSAITEFINDYKSLNKENRIVYIFCWNFEMYQQISSELKEELGQIQIKILPVDILKFYKLVQI